MDQSLGQKIDKRCGPQFGPDKRCIENDTFEGSEKGQDSIVTRWINDNSKRC